MGCFDLNLLLVNSILQGGGNWNSLTSQGVLIQKKKLPGAYDPVKH